MSSLVMKFLASLLAVFGLGGGHKGVSRFGFVPEGSVGIRLRFGKIIRHKDGTPKMQKPGWNWQHIPLLDKTHHPSIMLQGHELQSQDFQLKDQTFFAVRAKVSFRIVDVERVTVGLGNFETQWRLDSEAALVSVLSTLDAMALQDVKKVNQQLLEAVKGRGPALGVEFEDFEIVSMKPTHDTATIIQYERLISVKADALKANAAKLAGLDVNAAAILSGTAFLSTGSFTPNDDAATMGGAAVIPLQSVTETS